MLSSSLLFGQPKEVRNDEATFLKAVLTIYQSHVKLGLDIQGGVQLVLGSDQGAVDTRLGRIV